MTELKDMQIDIIPGDNPGEYKATMTPLTFKDPDTKEPMRHFIAWWKRASSEQKKQAEG
jgi:hypothetical protein